MPGDMSFLGRNRFAFVVIAVITALHAPLFAAGFWRDDFGILELVARRGPAEVLRLGFVDRWLGFVHDFWRPVSTLGVVAGTFVAGTTPLLWRGLSLLLAFSAVQNVARIFSETKDADRPVDPTGSESKEAGPKPARTGAIAAAAAAAVLLSPAMVEPTAWAVAGQQEFLALACFAAALAGFVRGRYSSLVWTALACGAKETGFILPGILFGAVFSFIRPEDRRRRLLLLATHVAIAAVLFGLRWNVLGGFTAAYAAGERASLAAALSSTAPLVLTGAWKAVGPGVLGLAAAGLVFAFARARVRSFGLVVAALAASAPLLAVPLVDLTPGGGYRFFVAPAFVLAIFGARALAVDCAGPRLRTVGAAILALSVLGSAIAGRSAGAAMRETIAESDRIVSGVANIEGEALLLGGVTDAVGWTFPAAEKPPFRNTARTAFPLRDGVRSTEPLLHLRPFDPGLVVVQITPHSAFATPVVPLDGADTAPAIRLRKNADLTFELVPFDPPLRALPWLRLRGPAGGTATVRLSWSHPDGHQWSAEFPFQVGPDEDAVVPLCDLAGFPTAKCTGLSVTGATAASLGPAPPLRMKLVAPIPGSALLPADLARPFVFENFPPGAKALRVTIHSAGGGMRFLAAAESASFASVDLANNALLQYMAASGLKLGESRFFLGIEAVRDLAHPDAILDRTAVASYRIAGFP